MSWDKPRNIQANRRLEKLCFMGLTRESLENLYWNKELNIAELCESFPGIDIYYWMKKWNIPRRSSSKGYSLAKIKQLEEKGITREVLYDLYVNKKMTTRQLKRLYKDSNISIQWWLKKFDIPIRSKSETNHIRPFPDSAKKKISEKQKKRFSDPKVRQEYSNRAKREYATGKRVVNTSAANKATREIWADPVLKAVMLKTIREKTLPTYPELLLDELLDNICPNKFEYTGDGKIIVGNLIPDFTCKTERKQVIEMFGDYWHKDEDPQVKINKYSELGYSCLVIWEHELYEQPNTNLTNKIKSFSGIV